MVKKRTKDYSYLHRFPRHLRPTTTRSGFSLGTAVVIVILVCAFLFMVLTSIYIHWCSDSPANSTTSASTIAARRRIAFTSLFAGYYYVQREGFCAAMISMLPILSYSALKDLK
ncbi:hypothetical protein CRG98_032835 [Punica granatum]|uniref:Uncharacterized protein n=1 Tax=Punica granatum TaxID=22663 RepID=A0A2I0IST2_PUNGR|nr:hypothetical protein CRG98_032835 [Punica granatum]